MLEERDVWTELESLADPVDPRLGQWSLGELSASEEAELLRTVDDDALLELYRPLTPKETRRCDPRTVTSKLRVLPGGLSTAIGLALAAGVAGVLVIAGGEDRTIAIEMTGPVAAVEDRDVIDVSIEVARMVDHLTLWIEDGDALRATDAKLSQDAKRAWVRARAGRVTGGHFGTVNLVAIAGDGPCAAPPTVQAAIRDGCTVARWPVTVGPPPLDIAQATVELSVLSEVSEHASVVVPVRGMVSIQLSYASGPVHGDIQYRFWRKSDGANWTSFRPVHWRKKDQTLSLRVDAATLLPVGASRGTLAVMAGPAGQPPGQPGDMTSKAWRMTTVPLLRAVRP